MAAPKCLRGVPQAKLNAKCKDSHLFELSLKIANWKSVAPFLGISEAVEHQIQNDSGETSSQKVAMFRRWKEMYGSKATYHKLTKALIKLKRMDLVEEICKMLSDGSTNSSSDESEGEPDLEMEVHKTIHGKRPNQRKTGTASQKRRRLDYEGDVHMVVTNSSSRSNEDYPAPQVHRNLLHRYEDHLRCKYKNEIPKNPQWPPPPTRKVFNLAMIHKASVQIGPVDKEYIRLTQRGSVDDIMLIKTAIKLEDIFNRCDPTRPRKIVLIEGAPGSGKSTLAWYICQRWGIKTLFGDCNFKVVVFVQLRDPAVQSCTSIADLLPRMSNNRQRKILSKLEARCGKGVLFVLDGWDEYSKGMVDDSICGKLIASPADLSMQESSLLITSRPVESRDLQEYCSIRIEIVGFTPKEAELFFQEALKEQQQEEQEEVLQECLRVRPVIQASCYLPLNAAIVVYLFLADGNSLPTTLHGLFTSLVLNCIARHVKKTKRDGGRGLMRKVNTFDRIPLELQPNFRAICELAYRNIKTNTASFSEEELQSCGISTEMSESLLSLIQGWTTFKSCWEEKSYCFFHLSFQELLAAFHISKLPPGEQVQEFRDLFDKPRFTTVLRFYAAFTKFQVEGIREFLKEILQRDDAAPTRRYQKRFASDEGGRCKAILDCLYEAQDPQLCQYVAALMDAELTVSYTMSSLHCVVLGYFLHCVSLTPGGGKFRIEFNAACLDETNCSYLVNELKSSNGQISLTFFGSGEDGIRSISVLVPMLQKSCSHCIKDLSLQVRFTKTYGPNVRPLTKFLHASSPKAPVVSLSLVPCTISLAGTRTLACILTSNLTLEILDISGCTMTQESAQLLARSLARNSTLKVLNIDRCRIPPEGKGALAVATVIRTTSDTWDLSGHILPLESAKMLAHSLATNCTVTTLNLSRCSLPRGGVRDLADSLAINSTLKTLNLSYCNISLEAISTLAVPLERNSNLTSLNLSHSQIPAGGLTILSVFLRSNSTLKVTLP